MNIVFVIDNYKQLSNGTNVTAYRFAEKLRKLGHQVKIVTNDFEGKDIYTLKTRYIPIVSRVSKKQDVTFARPNKKVLKEAFKEADVIHLFMPWKVSKVSLKLAKKMKIPVVTAFHVAPESVVLGAKLKFLSWFLTSYIYRRFRRFYKKNKHVHCPSFYTVKQLRKYKYPNQFHVISNGVGKEFTYSPTKRVKDKFNIVMIGRYAPEKNQQVLIRAINKSKYKDKIHLTLLGKGPDKRKLKHLAKRLNVSTTFSFLTKEELIKDFQKQHLYVHTAIIEIEGISCIEAIASGKVPLIANSKNSATPQFALDDRSLFESNNVDNLKEKIEYWIENEDIRQQMEKEYYEYSKKYAIEESVDRYLNMLKQAIFDYNNEQLIKTKKGAKVKKDMLGGKIVKTISKPFYYSTFPFLYVYNKAILRAKFVNKRHVKKIKGGAVLVSNHVHNLDSVMSGFVAFPKKVIFTAIRDNLELPYIGKIVKAFGTIPIPQTITENKVFFNELSKKVRKGKFVHFFPEGELVQGDKTLREFKKGAFKLAVESSAPIVPIRVNFEKRNPRKKNSKKRMVVKVGKPIYPNYMAHPKEAVEDLLARTENSMQILS